MNGKTVIIVPCFNEAKRLNLSYFNELTKVRDTFWIFVDDGSTDNTGKILSHYSKNKNVIYLATDKNLGKAKAIAYGMKNALQTVSNIKWIGFLDSDGAFSLSDIKHNIGMLDHKEKMMFNAIYSSRVKLAGRNINRNYKRHLISRIITTIFGIIWKNIPYDTQSGFKLYRNSNEFKLIFLKPFRTRWFFDIELSIRYLEIYNFELKVWEEPVSFWNDVAESKINMQEVLRLIWEIVYIFGIIIRSKKLIKK